MSTTTTNLNMVLNEGQDKFSIPTLNENLTKIDTAIGEQNKNMTLFSVKTLSNITTQKGIVSSSIPFVCNCVEWVVLAKTGVANDYESNVSLTNWNYDQGKLTISFYCNRADIFDITILIAYKN